MGAQTTNGDGFDVGRYGDEPEPGVYDSIAPAWNDRNLHGPAAHVQVEIVSRARPRVDRHGHPADELRGVAMSFPNYRRKHSGQAVFSPERVNEERRRIGLWPSRLDAVGAIVCYDPTLWEKVTAWPTRVACDGWLEGAFLLPVGAQHVLAMRATGVGAPTSVITLEELIAAGIDRIVNLGSAGGLQAQTKIGDLVVCEAAIRDEGTSYHYLPDAKFAYPCPDLTADLCAAIERADIPFRKGVSWTTDAPYRETIDEIRSYREEGVATVEMEAAALFAVAGLRGASVASVFVISDLVSEAGWEHAFRTEALQSALVEIFEIALGTLASPASNRSARTGMAP